jgi:hypothetical protein
MTVFDALREGAAAAGITEAEALARAQAMLDRIPDGDCEECERRPALIACQDGKNRCESCCEADGFDAATGSRLLTREAVQAALSASFEQGVEELHERIFGTANGDDASYAALGTELRALEAAGIAARRSIGPGMILWRRLRSQPRRAGGWHSTARCHMNEELQEALWQAIGMAQHGHRVVFVANGSEYPLPSSLNNESSLRAALEALKTDDPDPLLAWMKALP